MEILEVILIASQLALVVCLPQDIRFVKPVPAESVSLGLSNNDGQRRVFSETFFISDRSQNQFASGSPNVVTVAFAGSESYPSVHFVQQPGATPPNYEPQAQQPIQHSGQPDSSSGQWAGIVFEDAFRPRPDRVANFEHQKKVGEQPRPRPDRVENFEHQNEVGEQPRPRPDRVANFEHQNEVVEQQQGYVIIPSRQTAQDRLELNDKQEQRLPNPELFIFRSPATEQQRTEGYLYGDAIATQAFADDAPNKDTSSGQLISHHGSPAGSQGPLQNHGQAIDSTVLSHGHPSSESHSIAGVKQKASQTGYVDAPRSDATLVTRLTAPSNDPRSPNTLMITRRPCEICCVGNEVAPCKSCCAHTPLLNPKTLKTVVG